MMRQMKNMAKLELSNLYGLNVFRFTKDRRAKRKYMGLVAVWCLLGAMLAGYLSSLSYGLIYLGLEDVVPAYFMMFSSLLAFVFGMLKAGSMIFRREGYDVLCALPMPTGVIAASRLLRMYVENWLMAFAVLLPGFAVYAWKVRPGGAFYPAAFFCIWIVPLLPMSAAILIGALITGIASRMRHKSLAASILSLAAVVAVLYGTSRFSGMEDELDAQMLKNLSTVVMGLLERIYPPAVWLGNAVARGSMAQGLLCAAVSLAAFVSVSVGVALCFPKICQRLYGSFATHRYEAGEQKAGSVSSALCKREFRRYFSSSVYVTNTIIGPLMGCVFAGMAFAAGIERFKSLLPFALDTGMLIPYVLACTFSMMPVTAVSISMEGKNWWIAKSLPLSVKQVLDAKIAMNLLLLLPFYVISEVFLMLAVKPGGWELLWMLLVPAVLAVFSCVYGIAVNLHFPVLRWENEASVVKQSASSLLGGLGGSVFAVACIAGAVWFGGAYANLYHGGVCGVVVLVTVGLYRHNNRFGLCGELQS